MHTRLTGSLLTILSFAGLAPFPAIAESPSQVRIVHEAGRYRLLVDGQPYVVKGAGMADGGQETLAARGGNSFRTWSTGTDEANVRASSLTPRANGSVE